MSKEELLIITGFCATSLIGFIVWWLRSTRSAIKNHVKNEEAITWPRFEGKIDNLKEQVHNNHVLYIKSFGKIETRLALLETTNGEVLEVIEAIKGLSAQISSLNGKVGK